MPQAIYIYIYIYIYLFIAGGAEDRSPEKGIGFPKVQLSSFCEDIFYYVRDKMVPGLKNYLLRLIDHLLRLKRFFGVT